MPIYSRHPQYMQHEDQWRRCRDACDGEDSVKARGKLYLPMLTGQTKTEYANYVMRSAFFAATARTVQGLAGAIMRKPPVIEVPEGMKSLLEDVTGTDVGITEFINMVIEEVLITGRCGILCDMQAMDIEVDDMYPRPYLCLYNSESITFWLFDKSLIVLEEVLYEPHPEDPYHLLKVVQYRELTYLEAEEAREGDIENSWELNETGQMQGPRNASGIAGVSDLKDEGRSKLQAKIPGPPHYAVRVYRQVMGAAGWEVIELAEPTIKGLPMEEIPFVFINPVDTSPRIKKPPLLDMVNINLSHYRTSADLEHGRHFTALPTPWVSGLMDDDEVELSIGSTTAWLLPNEHARAGFLEFTGQGLKALETALAEKESQMSALGSRMLENQKNAAEAADTVRIRQNADVFTLSTIATTVENGVSDALKYMARWLGLDESKVSVKLNKDFIDAQLDGRDLQALVAAVQAGVLSLDTFLYAMQRADILPPNVSPEDERDRILLNPQIELNLDNTGDGKKTGTSVPDENAISSGVGNELGVISGPNGSFSPGFGDGVGGLGSTVDINPDPTGAGGGF